MLPELLVSARANFSVWFTTVWSIVNTPCVSTAHRLFWDLGRWIQTLCHRYRIYHGTIWLEALRTTPNKNYAAKLPPAVAICSLDWHSASGFKSVHVTKFKPKAFILNLGSNDTMFAASGPTTTLHSEVESLRVGTDSTHDVEPKRATDEVNRLDISWKFRIFHQK